MVSTRQPSLEWREEKKTEKCTHDEVYDYETRTRRYGLRGEGCRLCLCLFSCSSSSCITACVIRPSSYTKISAAGGFLGGVELREGPNGKAHVPCPRFFLVVCSDLALGVKRLPVSSLALSRWDIYFAYHTYLLICHSKSKFIQTRIEVIVCGVDMNRALVLIVSMFILHGHVVIFDTSWIESRRIVNSMEEVRDCWGNSEGKAETGLAGWKGAKGEYVIGAESNEALHCSSTASLKHSEMEKMAHHSFIHS